MRVPEISLSCSSPWVSLAFFSFFEHHHAPNASPPRSLPTQSICPQRPLIPSFIHILPCVSMSSEIRRHHREKSTAPTLRKLGVRVRSRRRKGSVAVRWDVWNFRTQSRDQLTPVSPLIHQHTNRWRLPVARDLQHQHQLLHRPRSLRRS